MAVITLTDEEKLELSLLLDDAKRPFEKSLERDLNALFAVIASDVLASYSTFGTVPSVEQYRQELEAIFKKSYRKAGAFFSSVFQRIMRQYEPTSDQNAEDLKELREDRRSIDELIFLALLPFYSRQAVTQAGFVLNTTEKIIQDVEFQVVSEQAATGDIQSQLEVAKDIAKEVNKRNRVRSPNISEDQVGDIAQKSQDTEVKELAKVAQRNRTPVEPSKSWITTFIRSRAAHIAAHLQKRRLNELYNVGGELLEYPKDQSHGASLDNVINCRCTSVTTM